MGKKHYPQNKELRAVIETAEKSKLWTYEEKGSGHLTGVLRCDPPDFEGEGEQRRILCSFSCYSTPEPPGYWARDLARKIARCPHGCALDRRGRLRTPQ